MPPPETTAEPSPRPARRGRWLAWAGTGLLAIALPLGGLWALLHDRAVLPWLLQQVPGLTVQGLHGTLAEGRLQAQSLHWQLPAGAGQLEIDGLVAEGGALRWAPHPGAWFGLRLTQLSADRVQYRSGPASAQRVSAPADLLLPLALQVDALRIDSLQVNDLAPAQALSARLWLGAQGGTQHRVESLRWTWQRTELQAELLIGSDSAMPVQARLQARRDLAPAWDASLSLSGPLASMTADARLQGRSRVKAGSPGAAASSVPSLSAQASLLPFKAWPLGELRLETQSLDLSALLPSLPRTALSGQAKLLSSGLDSAASASVTLVNQLPGAWDAGRLPIQQLALQASAAPRHPEQLKLEHFTLALADASGSAGRISGQGRWAEDAVALDLTLTQLLPARLHRQAAALVLGGPLQLRITGLPSPDPIGQPAGSAKAAAKTPPRAAGQQVPAPRVQLSVDAQLTGRSLDDSGQPMQLSLKGLGSANAVELTEFRASTGPASVQGRVQASAQADGWRLRSQASLANFDPRPWWRGAEGSAWRLGPHRLDSQIDLDLLWRNAAGPALAAAQLPALEHWLSRIDGLAHLSLSNSLLAGVPLAGSLQLQRAAPEQAASLDAHLVLAGNQIDLQGQRAAQPSADRWKLQLKASALAGLAPLARLANEWAPELSADLARYWPTSGQLQADLQTNGRWPAISSQGELRADALVAGVGALHSATLGWRSGSDLDAPLSLQLQAQGLSSAGQRIDDLAARLSGSLRDHSLSLRIDSPAKPPAWTENLLGPAGSGTRLQAQGRGGWIEGQAGAGTWRLQDLQLQGGARDSQGGSRPWLTAQSLAAELALGPDLRAQALTLAPGRVQLLSTALNWREARWQAALAGPADTQTSVTTSRAPSPGPGRLSVLAELERFDVAAMLARAQPTMGWGGQLTLGGHIEIRSAERFDADVVLERLSGDLSLTDDLGSTQVLGVTELRLALTAHDGLWQFAQGLAGVSLGEMAGAQVLRTSADRRWPPADASLQGVLESRVSNLGVWGSWVPPGWRLAGKLQTSASFGGTLGAPELRGEVVGSGLGVRNLLQGVNLTDGELALTLAGASARIERLVFKGGDGQLRLSGSATLGAAPSASLQLAAERFRLLGRIDRRLVTSGQAELRLDAQRLRLDGSFSVDEGLLELGQGEAPTLDKDVQVRRGAASASAPVDRSASPLPPPALRQTQVALKINLGQKLRLRGHGVDTGLRGDLLVSSPEGKLALRGQVRAEGGTVAAYGQKLEIDRGTVNFAGALDNPQLDVLALRPNLDQRVGVSVTGPAQNPRIRLYSEPDLADYDKLSWLMLGRAPDGLGRSDTALLQRAALALLADKGQNPTQTLLEGLGLTDFSFRQGDGDNRETIVSLGKQLSKRWYLGYERSVNATTGTWQLIYRIAQRFTLRAQSGSENALDLIWSWRW